MSQQETGMAFEETWKASSTIEHLNAPLVSIVIPCHNYGRFLAEAIKSALNQTYINIEVIVIDDASTDNTREVTEQFAVTYVKTKHQGKATPAHAHNVGLQACHGDFVIFLGADDKLEPDYVEKCYAAFCKAQRKIGFVWTGFQAFGTQDFTSLPKTDTLTRFNCDSPSGQLGAMFVPKYMYEIVGDYDEALNGLEDLDWVIRACSKGFVGISIRETLHNYRFHGESVNSNAGKKQVIRELFRKHPLFFLLYNMKLWARRLKTILMENHKARIKLYNKTVTRFFNVPHLVEPPANTQHCWVNERSIMRKIKGSRVLDCGCGVGRWGWLLHKKHTVIGVDLVRNYLNKAKSQNCYEGLVQAHLSYLPFRNGCCDTVLASEVIEHLTFEEGKRFLRQLPELGRCLVLTTPKEFVPLNFGQGHAETHKSVWSKEQILSCLLGQRENPDVWVRNPDLKTHCRTV